ncbi:hypothetical protein ACTXT7_001380 [Hymenolepis weldensis]
MHFLGLMLLAVSRNGDDVDVVSSHFEKRPVSNSISEVIAAKDKSSLSVLGDSGSVLGELKLFVLADQKVVSPYNVTKLLEVRRERLEKLEEGRLRVQESSICTPNPVIGESLDLINEN